jgi:hypothetical protein
LRGSSGRRSRDTAAEVNLAVMYINGWGTQVN